MSTLFLYYSKFNTNNLYMQSFLKEYNNFLTKEDCDFIIDFFESNSKYHYQRSSLQQGYGIKDTSITLEVVRANKEISTFLSNLKEELSIKYREYLTGYVDYFFDEFPLMVNPIIHETKIQRSLPGESYGKWHYERGYMYTPSPYDRLMAYTIYLNDIKKGGETEFIHQNYKIKPEMGKLSIFPAEFTHMHRGIPSMDETKYIITGWFEHRKSI